ncbi:MAG TPA: methionine--tRNA ligase [Acidobacteriaceae bacterium]|jgi:methionyl-tRNA synthetase|nr:methionine--tRNA ligase [Acidobacteriaceae bacterium]
MSAEEKKFYVTTPIYYVNARPHIGHAYTTIVADVLARRHRLLGEDTFFLTGTDEHGQKIERSAAAAGVAPQQFADEVSGEFRRLWDRMGLSYDRYIRTTDECHKRGVQRLFTELYERGFIYLSTYTGSYCVSDEAFVDAPAGTPCPECGRTLETVTEENFFFKLSEFQQPLIELIESGGLAITPESRKNEVLSFVRGGLKDLSISRSSFTWGIPVPEEVQRKAGATRSHVIYVWLDALANYMTAIGYGTDNAGADAEFARYWPADLHLVGKEIIRFHCVYWPAFLLAAGLRLPKAITAHGWLLFDNAKMSKSKGNIVRTETILEAFGEHVYGTQFPESTKRERDLFAADVLRYFLLREIPFGQDGSFSFEAMVTRYNADLANGYGNLVSRTLAMIHQSFEGAVPHAYDQSVFRADTSVSVRRLAEDEVRFFSPDGTGWNFQLNQEFDRLSFNEVLFGVASGVAHVDLFLASTRPWILARNRELGDLCITLYVAAEAIRILTASLYPVLPFATAQVWAQLGLKDIEEAAKKGELNNLKWGGLKAGTKLGTLAPIFPRAPKELVDIMAELEDKNAMTTQGSQPAGEEQAQPQLEPNPPAGAPALVPPTEETVKSAQINIEDFAKVELRVAQIVVAERIPKADKLLRLEVDLGYERRQILSGIAEWYQPEELVGRRIVVVTNLAPRKMRGLESHGMLLAASEGEGGKPVLATFGEEIALGARLK